MSLRACAAAVAAHGGRFIAYGPGLACRMELTADVPRQSPATWPSELLSKYSPPTYFLTK